MAARKSGLLFLLSRNPDRHQAQTEKGQPLSPEKRIPELTAAIKKSGLTTGKATIAAQEMVTEAEKRFGANSTAVLDAYQPGQNPRQFLSGFQNAYILGTQGNQAALEKSKAAAYLTQEQRETAFNLGHRILTGTVEGQLDGEEVKDGDEYNKALETDDRYGIINERELFHKSDGGREGFNFISERRFKELTIQARKQGAIILRGSPEIEAHLTKVGATASQVDNALLFTRDVTVSEVLEETYHYMQNIRGENDDKESTLRTILNEISAKQYILDNAIKYGVPRREIEHITKQLEGYQQQLDEYNKEHE